MKEIGGYFELEKFQGEHYHNSPYKFSTVRDAMHFLIDVHKYKKIYLPVYLCESIAMMLSELNIEIEYYKIDECLKPVFNERMQTNEVIVIVNYFGCLCEADIIDYKRKYVNIIVDNTQSFFGKFIDGIDTVYTCRKYFGVPDGAYLCIDDSRKEFYEYYSRFDYNTVRDGMRHILGRVEEEASDFYNDYKVHEEVLCDISIRKMSIITDNFMRAIDYDYIKRKRRMNYEYIQQSLGDINELKLNNIGDFMYPLLLNNGKYIKEKLIQEKIYVPTLWPNVLSEDNYGTWEYYLAENLVLLPIDQRYDLNDMKRIVEAIACQK